MNAKSPEPMKHTPGPWITRLESAPMHAVQLAGQYGRAIVAYVPAPEGWSLAHQDANARLIAAAPELLDALKRMLAAYDADKARGIAFGNDNAADQARAAIAKAEGSEVPHV